MEIVIIVFAAFIILAGIVIIINPDTIFNQLNNNVDNEALYYLAILVRALLGLLLLIEAKYSKFIITIEIIGWLSLAAAIVFALIGRARFIKLMTWALSLDKTYARFGGAAALGFGGFLIYAFI